ncbi:MAG: hypothetical protein ACF8R7_01155 [Phycisphaerales bacterium JB039]
MRCALCALGAAAALSLCAGASGQWYWPPTGGVGVDPSCPHPDARLTLLVSGDWRDACPPNIARAAVRGFEVEVDLVRDPPPGPCPLVITPYAHEIPIGRLPAGDYTVFATYYEGDVLALPRTAAGKFTVDPGCPAPCYPDCDGSGALDFFDFLCFQNAFAAGDDYADCDESGALDFFDFLCFQNEFAGGCP